MTPLYKNSRFGAEIHIGFLAIVFLFLALNLVSNYVIYQARISSRETIQRTITLAGMATARAVREAFPILPDPEEIDNIRGYHGLTSLILVPSQPIDNSPAGRREWFAKMTLNLPQGQLPDLALKLVGAEPEQVTRGEFDEYFMVRSIPAGKNGLLMIASAQNSTLAFLDGSGMVIIIASLATLLVVSLAYLFLYRFIFSPFRKIKNIAHRAGRDTDENDIDVANIVEDYQRIIDELNEDKIKLARLNETITSRAHSLEQFNDYLLESIESGIVTLDMNGKIITISPKAAQMFSVDPFDYQGDYFNKLFACCRSMVVDLERVVGDSQIPPYTEHRARLSNDKQGILGVTISTIHDKQNSRLGYSILITDHTELHQLQTELEGRKRLTAMGEMAGGLAHQLRNSLGAINGFGNLVKRKLTNSGLPVNSVEDLLLESKEASNLISQFLDFARPFQLTQVDTNLKDFLLDILKGYHTRDRYQKCEFELEPLEDINLKFDPLLLKQAIINIIDNAAESHGDDPGFVNIKAVLGETDLELNISDQGCGIEPDELDQIFTPFFSKRSSGTGLGLPLAAKIINLHQGSIKVDSIPGQGTIFSLTIPFEQPSQGSKTMASYGKKSLG